MALRIPINGDSAYERVTVALEGQDYDISIRWNTRDESWYCYIGPVNSESTVKFKLVVGFNLIKHYRYLSGVPNGSLLLLDLEKGVGRPSRDNLGEERRFRLYYFLENEV